VGQSMLLLALSSGCHAERSGVARLVPLPLTPGFKLPAKYVIHAVGPSTQNPEALKSAYKASLSFIDGVTIRTIGLCCISIGIFGYPLQPATSIALETVREFLGDKANRQRTDRIVFVVQDSDAVEITKSSSHWVTPYRTMTIEDLSQSRGTKSRSASNRPLHYRGLGR
jgi:O-acetyl-ADP-ribose deacetylase (regulator of RNase III)